MRKKKTKPCCDLSVTSPIGMSKFVDKEIEPIIKKCEKELRKITKREKLYITGLIWVWEC